VTLATFVELLDASIAWVAAHRRTKQFAQSQSILPPRSRGLWPFASFHPMQACWNFGEWPG
jgi:hypothetical protein